MKNMMRTNDVTLNPRDRLAGVLIKLSAAWIYSFSLSQLTLQLNKVTFSPLAAGLLILAVLILLALLTWQRYGLLVLAVLLGAGALIGWLDYSRFERLIQKLILAAQAWLTWLWNRQILQTGGTEAQLQTLGWVIVVGTAILAYLAAARFNWPFLLFIILALTAFLGYTLPAGRTYPWIFLAGLVVVAAWARHQTGTYAQLGSERHRQQARFMLQATPVAAVGLALALLLGGLLPATFFRSSRMERLTLDLLDLLSAENPMPKSFEGFSIQIAGYYPYVGRLGGAVTLSKDPVLEVSGYQGGMLLRGSTSAYYSGYSWSHEQDTVSIRFGNPVRAADQLAVFETDLPDMTRYPRYPEGIEDIIYYGIKPIEQPIHTLFLAGRPLEAANLTDRLSSFFFDRSGTLFAKYAVLPGETVQLTAKRILTGNTIFTGFAAACRESATDAERARLAAAGDRYLQLPLLREYEKGGQVYNLVQQLTRGINEPYDRCLKLAEYLESHCQYKLDVPEPPRDAEFVRWFLDKQEGYCVYFATALTMMCRLADVPARYAEGYYAPPTVAEGGIRVLSGEYAHAWTEVYLSGIGWVTLDATPGGPVWNNAGEQPTPSISSRPTMSPPSATPNQPTLTPRPAGESNRLAVWFMIVLAALPLILGGIFVVWKIAAWRMIHHVRRLRRHLRDDRLVIRCYWQEIQAILLLLGDGRRPGESPRGLITRILDTTHWLDEQPDEAAEVLVFIEEVLYSTHMPDETAAGRTARLVQRLDALLKARKGRLHFLLRRILAARWPVRGGAAGDIQTAGDLIS
jgi:hypothetical protein